MSAFVVDRDEIDMLVAAGAEVAKDEHPTQDHLDRIGRMLWDECVRSVSFRYPNDDLGELPGSYETDGSLPGVEPVEVAQWLIPYVHRTPAEPITRRTLEETIGSYEYQSCEHPEWPESWAYAYCAGLRNCLDRFPAEPKPEPVALDPELYGDLSRDDAIKRIRAALKRRSGKAWSVTGGKGTAWGWISIQAPPKRRTGKHVQKPGAAVGEYEHVDTGEPQEFGIMTPQDCAELGELLGKDRPVHPQGESIPAGSDYRREYIDRAEGRTPSTHGVPYWD